MKITFFALSRQDEDMNKGRRNELRKLKFKKRLSVRGLKQKTPRDYVCFKDQGQPCSCYMCSGSKYNRAKSKRELA